MKILIPSSSSSKGCVLLTCDIYECEKPDGTKKKKRSWQKTPRCGRYWCGQVTTSGEEK